MIYKCVYKVYIVNDFNFIKILFLLMIYMCFVIYIKIEYNKINKIELKIKYFFVIDIDFKLFI